MLGRGKRQALLLTGQRAGGTAPGRRESDAGNIPLLSGLYPHPNHQSAGDEPVQRARDDPCFMARDGRAAAIFGRQSGQKNALLQGGKGSFR